MMKARIYRPAKSATQSGRAHTEGWMLEYEPETPRLPEPLMGWIASGDTLSQIKLHFSTLEEAEAYARKNHLTYVVQLPHARRIKARNYGDNFIYRPVVETKNR